MLVLILAVIKVYTPLFNHIAAYRACRGGEVLVNIAFIAFSSKIGARVVPWLPLPPAGPPLIKRFRQ